MTLGEVARWFKGVNFRRRADLKLQANVAYNQAVLLGTIIGKVLNGKGEIPYFEEAFGFVFTDEEIKEIRIERQVARLKAFSQSFNARR